MALSLTVGTEACLEGGGGGGKGRRGRRWREVGGGGGGGGKGEGRGREGEEVEGRGRSYGRSYLCWKVVSCFPLQARVVKTGELVALKIIKIEPGESLYGMIQGPYMV